ncbi:EDSAP-1 family PEP-CTERM protein [Crenalkalicoccus roseus]|uniref:EDSAP-1 family PEP-CTERM protein n=1 Tax=Crenalkalicoccus roseus TaxID=1485588 RepID=UPI001081BD97|nr:EDSAP-1 family PEP-CTERM protein [Crenalkalicoccus roseus]
MQSSTGGWLRRTLFAGAAALAVAAAPIAAEAAPYAYASNQITNLTVTYADGSSILAPGGTNLAQANTSISGSAFFTGFAPGGSFNSGVVGAALEMPQAFSGPGPAPGENTFNPAGAPGTFIGTRADANIGAGTAQTGVAVNNVVEGYGVVSGTSGTSTANNTATITWSVVGTGQGLLVQFNDLIQLIASTAVAFGESATATIANTLQLRNAAGVLIFEAAPAEINRQVGSGAGVPPTASINETHSISILTPALVSGQSYTVSLTSQATQSITVGVPEPATLALLGAGLLGLAAVRRRKAA